MSDIAPVTPIPPARSWLLRIPEVFAPWNAEILSSVTSSKPVPLGTGYFLVPAGDGSGLAGSPAAPFVAWNLPVQHSWPCHPAAMEQFIEKAAQALTNRFAPCEPQALLAGSLQAGAPDRYYKSLASNLRGRALQLFPRLKDAPVADDLDPQRPVLYVLVGKEGMFAGMHCPRDANGFHPGGTRFIQQNRPETISRAGAKIAEALHWLRLHEPLPAAGSHWLELGASPGGMTSELLDRGYRVTALDRAALDSRLRGRAGLNFIQADVASWQMPGEAQFDAILCDMNGPAAHSLAQVVRLIRRMRLGALGIFTLKTPGAPHFPDVNALLRATRGTLERSGVELVAITHLTYNRLEFTCLLRNPA